MARKATQESSDIELLLLSDSDALAIGNDLKNTITSEDGIYQDEHGNYRKQKKKVYTLEGDEAMKFLGLPPRKHNLLVMFDHRRIGLHFDVWIKNIIKAGGNQNDLFWKNLKIRVWKNANIGEETEEYFEKHTDKTYAPQVYRGEIFAGNALEGFLPNEQKSARYHEYKVQLISVTVTEDMERASTYTR